MCNSQIFYPQSKSETIQQISGVVGAETLIKIAHRCLAAETKLEAEHRTNAVKLCRPQIDEECMKWTLLPIVHDSSDFLLTLLEPKAIAVPSLMADNGPAKMVLKVAIHMIRKLALRLVQVMPCIADVRCRLLRASGGHRTREVGEDVAPGSIDFWTCNCISRFCQQCQGYQGYDREAENVTGQSCCRGAVL